MAEFIPELKQLIKKNQAEATKEKLSGILDRPEEDQEAVIELLALASDKTALDLLSFLMDTIDEKHPVHARLYQLTSDRAHLNFEFVLLLLRHAGPDRLNQLTPLLKHILTRETKGTLLTQILRTVGILRMESLVDELAEFVFYDDQALRMEAVRALERIGTIKAVERLEQIAATRKCDQDILDALDVLRMGLPNQDSPAQPKEPEKEEPQEAPLAVNIDMLAAPRIEDRFKAFEYFSDNADQVAEALHTNMETKEPDLMVNLLRLAARTIPQDSLGDLLTLADRKGLESAVRFSVYTALAHFPELESTAQIVSAATDPAMYIRMAAVKVLDRHCSDYIIAEIKNKIESGTKTGEALGLTILDAKAERLIDALMNSDAFSFISSNYLERNAPVQVIDAYMNVLKKRNRNSTLRKYARVRQEREDTDRPVFVVIHPSTTFLDVYAKLIHGCGYEAHTFSGPQEAFEFIVSQKPAAIICDFFVRQMSALELAAEIRGLYTSEDVPIIISSLQKNFDKTSLEKDFEKAAINGFWEFPAKPSQIKSVAGTS
ncbi:MAG: hypothetical protein MI892_30275 [Desulfobacterales bacterium]|nr:hypothetical protein [Desulfobacterales bacterium]